MLSGYGQYAPSMELDAIAAVVIGGTMLTGGVGNVIGTAFGVMITGTIISILQFNGTLSSWWTRIVVGVLTLLFIGIQVFLYREANDRERDSSAPINPRHHDRRASVGTLNACQPSNSGAGGSANHGRSRSFNRSCTHGRGPRSASAAPVTIVEYADFGCPACWEWHKRVFLDQLRAKYGDQIRFVWRDFPVITLLSPKAAEAGQCAHEQNKFWEFHQGAVSPVGASAARPRASGPTWQDVGGVVASDRLDVLIVGGGAR